MLGLLIKKRQTKDSEEFDHKYEIVKSVLIAVAIILLEVGIYIYTNF